MHHGMDGMDAGVAEELASNARRLQSYIRRNLGKHIRESAADIAQECILLAIRRDRERGAFDPSALSFQRLAHLAKLTIMSKSRGSRTRATVDDAALSDASDRVSPLGAAAASRRAAHTLANLRVDQHWAMVLRDVLGVSWETIVLVLDQPSVNAARCLHQRARRALVDQPGLPQR